MSTDHRPLLVFVMGPTGAGKSTLLDLLRQCDADVCRVATVEVGKTLRAKYPPEHFAGQCNPQHMQEEAWAICEEGVKSAREAGAQLILVDGQPRDIPQVHLSIERFPDSEYRKKYLLLYVPLEERDRRVRDRKDYESLAKPRLTNDMVAYFAVVSELQRKGHIIEWAFPYDGGTVEPAFGLPVPGMLAIHNTAKRLIEEAIRAQTTLASGGVVPYEPGVRGCRPLLPGRLGGIRVGSRDGAPEVASPASNGEPAGAADAEGVRVDRGVQSVDEGDRTRGSQGSLADADMRDRNLGFGLHDPQPGSGQRSEEVAKAFYGGGAFSGPGEN